MKTIPWLPASVVSIFFISTLFAPAAEPLPRSTPEAQGVSSQAVLQFVEALDRNPGMSSFMVLRHGHVIAEGWWKPETADTPHLLNSVAKSFNSTAVGMVIADGKVNLDDHVLKFFPNDAPDDPSDNLKAVTVRDLLTMTAGHDVAPKSAVLYGSSVKQFLAAPVVYQPGTHFLYDSMGSYTLSAIVTKVTGKTTLEFLKARLFEPLGIENPVWTNSPEGITIGQGGLWLRTEDIAKFGQLYLQKGKWNGEQLIPESWVEQATSKQVPNDQEAHAKMGADWRQGYGFQFWMCTHNAYRCDGAGGQFCVVIPDRDMVVAMTADNTDMQRELDAIWNLLPACQPTALPEDAVTQEKIKQATAKLEVRAKK